MVATSDTTEDSERSRGQLVLVGAVGIGLIIVGLVIVINTSLVSENIAASESLHQSDEVTKFSTNARRDTRAVVLRINHRKRNLTAPQIATYVDRNLTNYSRALAESYARSGIAGVNISFNNETSKWGTRVVQVNDSDLTEPGSNNASWGLFESTARKPDVRRFIMNLNVTTTSTKEFNVTFENATGDYVEMGFRSNGNEIEIRTERTLGGNVTDAVCDPSNDRVLVNLVTGRSYTGDCYFNGVLNRTNRSRSLKPPYEQVSIRQGDHASLQYSVVTNISYEGMGTSVPGYGHCDPEYGTAVMPSEPCRSPAIWRANVTTTYQSWSSDYWQLHNVSVYP